MAAKQPEILSIEIDPPSDPSAPAAPPSEPTPEPAVTLPGPPASGPPPTPPPAAETVLNGTRSEKEVALERELKAREIQIAELQDEHRRLKDIPKPPKPVAKKKGWLDGATFFDEG